MFFYQIFRSASLRYCAFALYVATLYLLQLDNETEVSDNLPEFISINSVVGYPGLQ